jgi:hypothetical protein
MSRFGTRWRSGGGKKAGKRANRDDDADSQKRSAVETVGKSSGGGEVRGAEGKERREIKGANQQLWK